MLIIDSTSKKLLIACLCTVGVHTSDKQAIVHGYPAKMCCTCSLKVEPSRWQLNDVASQVALEIFSRFAPKKLQRIISVARHKRFVWLLIIELLTLLSHWQRSIWAETQGEPTCQILWALLRPDHQQGQLKSTKPNGPIWSFASLHLRTFTCSITPALHIYLIHGVLMRKTRHWASA